MNTPERDRSSSDAKAQDAPILTKIARLGISPTHKRIGAVSSIGLFLFGIFLLFVIYYLQRKYHFSEAIRAWGWIGIVASILLMALLCIIPVPSEFLLLMNMNVYGIVWGIIYAWIGVLLGTVGIFLMARYLGRPALENFIPPDRFEQVESWVKSKGSIGLLMARLLPVPASVINYVAGVLKSVHWWDYLWTAAISMIPYYCAAALIYFGVSKRIVMLLIFGGVALVFVWFIGKHLSRRRQQRH